MGRAMYSAKQWSLCLLGWGLVGVLVCGGFSSSATAEDSLPLVEEHYDEVWLVHEDTSSRDWHLSRAYFIRQGRVVADRALHDEMHWTTTSSGQFQLSWEDYGQCQRMITFDSLVDLPHVASSVGQHGHQAWWCMNRRMTDLKAVVQP